MADEQETAAKQPRRVLIAGGGIAGLEALLALSDLAGDRVRVTLVAPDPEFTYKPLSVEELFTLQPAERRELEPAAREQGADFVQQTVVAVAPDEHAVELADGARLEYEALSSASALARSPRTARRPRSGSRASRSASTSWCPRPLMASHSASRSSCPQVPRGRCRSTSWL